MSYDNDNTRSYGNTHDNSSYDNTYDYDNTRSNISYDNTLFYDTLENFLYDNTRENIPCLPYDSAYENPSYDICLPYDTLENLSHDTYDTHENFSHDNVILAYDVIHKNLNLSDTHENIPDYDTHENFPHDAIHKDQSDDNQNADTLASLHQDYETNDNESEDELVELTDSLELISGLTFNSWDEFKSWINRFALKEGFNYKIRSSEKVEGLIRRATYECTKSGSNTSQITSDPTKRRNASSLKTSCPWKLNITYPKTSNVIKINSFNNEHNHPLTSIVHEIAPRFRKLVPEMLADIEKYVIQGRMDSASIYPLLKHDYPDQPIYKKDLYNAVYQFRQKNNPGNTDASQMLDLLMEWKDSDPLWVVKLRLDPVSKKLKSLLWMAPIQKELYGKYNDVTIIDTTYNTNRFQMMLCIISVIDNNYKSRIVASAIIDDETLDTYRWVFDTILTETGISPGVIFTDSDPSMIQSIKEVYPNTKHLLCIFHIDLNLRKKLKGKLGNKFEEFRHKFYTCRNSLCEDLFELRWNQLIDQYQAAEKYLSGTLYVNKESWAIPWIYKRFTTGAQSTQRIESINRHIHDKVDQATSLCDLLLSIKDYVRNEEHLENFELERNAIPTIGMPMLNTRFFSSVDNIMKAFLTPVMLGKQRSQMNQSVCYDINKITEWQNLIDVEIDNEEISNGIREQEQDVRQILFRSLVKNIPSEAILEVWFVRATGTQGVGHYVVLLDEGTHLCTCLLLINKGLICRHFFRVGTYSQHATFHISMIPNRWYLDINIQSKNFSQYPPIPVCGTQTENRVGMEKSITFQHFFSFRVDSHDSNLVIKSTKAIYAELFGLSKKAIDCALKANMQHELVNLLKAFIYDTHNKNVQKTQKTQEIETFTVINNPDITKHKGRPPKRLKSSVETLGKRVLKDSTKVNITNNVIVEEETNNIKGRKCGKCKQYGHYAKTCQNSC